MNLKEFFEKIDIEEIKSFVEEQTAEDLFLEFKTANFPNEIEYDKKNFSKCLSGFSNSSGGILIWGISAKEKKNKPDVANELKPIKDLIRFETYLKKNEGNAIIPLVEGIEYKRVLESENCGYLLIYIPPSDRAPHMALFADKRYYKRSGDSFYICEHFDILDMINRKTAPRLELEIINESVKEEKHRNEDYEKYEGIICIRNVGQVSAKHITLTLKISYPFSISNYGLDGNRTKGMKSISLKPSMPKYIGGSELVIHPETFHEVDKLVFNETYFHNPKLQDLKIEYTLIAEGMKLKKGVIEKNKDELKNKTSA